MHFPEADLLLHVARHLHQLLQDTNLEEINRVRSEKGKCPYMDTIR